MSAWNWDSNGEALWIMERYCRLTGTSPPAAWNDSVRRGVRWIMKKRLSDRSDAPHAGLLPAGFSAEHLGPNDFCFWDDYWSVAGLRSASRMLRQRGDAKLAERCEREADSLSGAIERALQLTADQRPRGGIPASPYRRLDAGAIGSLVASYPLQLVSPNDQRLNHTVEFLLQHCFVKGGFFSGHDPLGNQPLGDRQMRFYPPVGRKGLMVTSYLESVLERIRRRLISCISELETLTPVA